LNNGAFHRRDAIFLAITTRLTAIFSAGVQSQMSMMHTTVVSKAAVPSAVPSALSLNSVIDEQHTMINDDHDTLPVGRFIVA